MKLTCPTCLAGIDPNEVNLKEGIAHCNTCNEYFKIADFLQDAAVIRRTEQPETSNITVNRYAEYTYFGIPAVGLTTATAFFIVFAVILMICALVMLINVFQGERMAWLKMIGMGTFGIFLAHHFLRTAFETTSITFGRMGLTIAKDLWGWRREKGGNTVDLEEITEEMHSSDEGAPTFEILFTFRTGQKLQFGSHLQTEERKWLLGELNALKDQYAMERLKGQVQK